MPDNTSLLPSLHQESAYREFAKDIDLDSPPATGQNLIDWFMYSHGEQTIVNEDGLKDSDCLCYTRDDETVCFSDMVNGVMDAGEAKEACGTVRTEAMPQEVWELMKAAQSCKDAKDESWLSCLTDQRMK